MTRTKTPARAPAKRSVGRPPKQGEAGSTRERLLQAGYEIAMAAGLRAVTVAALAERTGANAGSFVYHFGTREAFLGELVERWYTPFMAGLQQASVQSDEPLARLRELLVTLALWARHHGLFVANLLADAAAGEVVAQRFLSSVPGRHPALILRAVREAQAAGVIDAGPPVALMMFLMASVALPPVFAAGLIHGELLPASADKALRCTLDEAGSVQRLEWALKGVTVTPAAKRSSKGARRAPAR